MLIQGFGKDMIIREKIFSQLKDVFQKHGGMELDTPVFELKEILSGKVRPDLRILPSPTTEGIREPRDPLPPNTRGRS